MDALTLVITILQLLCGLAIIVAVLFQSGKSAGLSGAIGGGAEMLVGKTKARGMDAVLAKMTKIAAVGFMILAVALVVINRFAA